MISGALSTIGPYIAPSFFSASGLLLLAAIAFVFDRHFRIATVGAALAGVGIYLGWLAMYA